MHMLQRLCKELLSILFPVFCVQCHKEGEWWCHACRAKESVVLQHFCPACNATLEPFTSCAPCTANGRALGGATALFAYADGSAIKELVALFKYHSVRGLQELWKEVLVAIKIPDAWSRATLAPVPLYKKRLRERGYNQSELLAKIIAEQNSVVINVAQLMRMRHTPHQVGLSRAQRLKNTADAFAWVGQLRAPEQVIIVDDVCTTGSTLESCAQALKQRGSKQVWAVVLARD